MRETNRLWIPTKMAAKSTVLLLLFLTMEAVEGEHPTGPHHRVSK